MKLEGPRHLPWLAEVARGGTKTRRARPRAWEEQGTGEGGQAYSGSWAWGGWWGGHLEGGDAALPPVHWHLLLSLGAALVLFVLLSTWGKQESPISSSCPCSQHPLYQGEDKPPGRRCHRHSGLPAGQRLCPPAPPASARHLPTGRDKWPSVQKPLSVPPGYAPHPGYQQRSKQAQPTREAGQPRCPQALMTTKLGSERTARTQGLMCLVGRASGFPAPIFFRGSGHSPGTQKSAPFSATVLSRLWANLQSAERIRWAARLLRRLRKSCPHHPWGLGGSTGASSSTSSWKETQRGHRLHRRGGGPGTEAAAAQFASLGRGAGSPYWF